MTAARVAGSVLLATVLLAAVAGPASAGPDPSESPCEAVLAALRGLGAAPRFHWSMTATTPGRRVPKTREQIAIDDDVYLTPDEGNWMRAKVPVAERKEKMDQELGRAPPAECHEDGREVRDGIPMHAIGFTQGDKSKRIWIGDADGLPHYFTSSEPPVSVTMHVDYTNVHSPLAD